MAKTSSNRNRIIQRARRVPGPSVALEGEVDDEDEYLDIMIKNEQK